MNIKMAITNNNSSTNIESYRGSSQNDFSSRRMTNFQSTKKKSRQDSILIDSEKTEPEVEGNPRIKIKI